MFILVLIGDLENDSLNSTHWLRLRTIEKFLQSFSTATLETQGDNATLDDVLITMDTLVKIFEINLVFLPFLSYLTLLITDALKENTG